MGRMDARYGVGIGWRPEIAGYVADLPGLRFTEVIAESVRPSALNPALAALRDKGVTVIPHGVKLSLGGAEPVDPKRVRHLAECAEALGSPWVSEHISFCRAGGLEVGHLTPLPRTRDSVKVMVDNVKRVQADLPVPIALEPIAVVFDWPDPELTEAEFLTEILDRTGALLRSPRRCSTSYRWSASRTCTSPAARSTTASTTTPTPTRPRPRCSTSSASCASGTGRRP
jgi:uncharacterized protein